VSINRSIFRYSFALLGLVLAACGTTYGMYHRVEPGETMPNIARTYGVDEEALRIINGLEDGPVEPGRDVFIPGANRKRYVSGSSAQKPEPKDKTAAVPAKPGAKKPAGNPEVARVQPEAAAPAQNAGNSRFTWPVQGVLFSKYGKRDGLDHDGIDISAPEGTPVKAAADGRVIYSGDEVRGYGNLVIVKHEGFYSTVYAHNAENLVAKGDFVEAGQIIARVGKTGRASGPHLHFEVRYQSKPVDPVKVLPASATQVSER
jgi:murein DD-endopeptidase MepM/ murein hydrolase activator NlpD